MFERTYTRRSVLRRSLATAGAGALVAGAGCSSIPNPLGGGPPYAGWLPLPDELGDSDHYGFTYINLNDVESNEDEFSEDSLDPATFEDSWEPLSFNWEDASGITLLNFGFSGFVVEAEFDREDAISDLEDEDFDEDSDYEGYTLMVNEGESRVFAVGDGAVVITAAGSFFGGTPETGATDVAEAIIDAQTGNADRYAEDNDDMSTLVGALGGGTVVNGRTRDEPDEPDPENGTFENMVAVGQRANVNGETANLKYVVVYESSDDVDTNDLEEWVEENDGNDDQFDDVDDISYNSNGRKGIITGTINTDDL